jgi:hypothetical protein
VNVVLWAFHLAVLFYARPLLGDWWNGVVVLGRTVERKRWLVVLSVGMPPVAAIWLLPTAIVHRADLHGERQRNGRIERLNADIHQHAADIAFWREQVAQGDLYSASVGVELLSMWSVPVVEPEPLPGAHAYSGSCDCRNCVRVRTRQSPMVLRLGDAEI